MTSRTGPFARTLWLPRVDSTSNLMADFLTADAAGWPSMSVVATTHQLTGRGRLGRQWITPAGAALTASIVIRPGVPRDTWGWLPLLTGVSVCAALADAGVSASLKWPNDVVVAASSEVAGWGPRRKLGGILAETVPADPTAVVLGVGVNLLQQESDLPVPWATSVSQVLDGSGSPTPSAGSLLSRIGQELSQLVVRWREAGGDAESPGVASLVRSRCSTLGTRVAVSKADGAVVEGEAESIDSAGRLVLATGSGPVPIESGDVHHLRS